MFRRYLRRLDAHLERGLLLFLFTLMVTLTGMQIFRRFVLNTSTTWNVEIITYVYIFASWVGAAYVVTRRTHLKMDLLQSRFPPQFRLATLVLSNVLFAALICYLIYQLYPVVEVQFRTGRSLFGVPSINIWYFYATVPVGMGLIIVRLVQNTVEDIRTYRESREFVSGEAIFEVD